MIAPVLQNGLVLELTGDIISRPYIDLTLQLMTDFGAQAAWTDARHIEVKPIPYRSTPYYIESDWSAASYWYQMTALCTDANAEIILPGLYRHSSQGDSAVRDLFKSLGVHTAFFKDENGLECVKLTKGTMTATRMNYDFSIQPDLAQTFAVTCASSASHSHFRRAAKSENQRDRPHSRPHP